MVYYFTSNVVSPSAFVYVGKDKVENEELIKFGWEEDVWYLLDPPANEVLMLIAVQGMCSVDRCRAPPTEVQFHVDNLSSAHIYLRMREGETWDNIPTDLLTDCAQLTKANSIEGNKKDNITVIYTPWSNLKKDGSMAVGQVGFKDNKKVKKIHVAQRENPIVNRLNKTKVEKFPDLKAEREDRMKELRKKDRAAHQQRQKEEQQLAKERKELKWQKDHAYDDLYTEDNLAASSNQNRDENFLDDFM